MPQVEELVRPNRVLSVVMPTYNDEDASAEIVGLVLNPPCTAGLLIIDDASSDRAAAVIRAMGDPRSVLHSSALARLQAPTASAAKAWCALAHEIEGVRVA